MTESRVKQKELRPILHKFNKQLFKLKFQTIQDKNNPTIWYSLGRLYQIQQNYLYAMNSFFIASKLNENNIDLKIYYLAARFTVSKGYVDNIFFDVIKNVVLNNPINNTALAFINVHNLLAYCFKQIYVRK